MSITLHNIKETSKAMGRGIKNNVQAIWTVLAENDGLKTWKSPEERNEYFEKRGWDFMTAPELPKPNPHRSFIGSYGIHS